MNKAWVVHLKNKFPDKKVSADENSVDVYDADGSHYLAVRKDGGGSWRDVSEELGLPGRFDLAPIPKEARVHKLHKDGKIGLDERHEERLAKRDQFKCKESGKIKSIDELQAEGMRFDREGYLKEIGR